MSDGPDLIGALITRFIGVRGPTDPEAAQAWARLDDPQRQQLLWAATDPTAAGHLPSERDRWLVDVLAADRSARRRLDVAAPVLTGLLVLATVWGFGRAAFPAVANSFLVLALVAMIATSVLGWRRGARRRANAHNVRRTLRRPPV